MTRRPLTTQTRTSTMRISEVRGVALVSVLLIVALVAALAWRMVTQHQLTVAHTRHFLHGGQARHYALAGEEYARQALFADWEDEETRAIDTLLEEWANPQPDATARAGEAGQGMAPRTLRLEGGEVVVTITDLGGRFNLNALAGPDSAENLLRLRRLLEGLSLDPVLADAWLDWVDEDAELHEFGAEDGEHLMADEPFRAANAPAADASEMLVATPLAAEEWRKLHPHVTALPLGQLAVNVNTAGEEVLASLAPNLVRTEVQALVESPREFDSVETFTADHPAFGASVGTLAVASEFFEVHVRADILGRVSEIVSTLHRDPTTGELRVIRRREDAPPREVQEGSLHGSTPPSTGEKPALPYASAVRAAPPAEGSLHGSTHPSTGEKPALPYASVARAAPPAEGSLHGNTPPSTGEKPALPYASAVRAAPAAEGS